MDDYGVSPFQMMRVLGPVIVIGPMLIAMLLSGPFVLYPIARWRQHRSGVTDPQLGLKSALEYFRMIAFQLGLLGLLIVIYTMLSKMPGDAKGDLYRTGFGLVVPTGILFAVHHMMLRNTNQAQFTGPRRLFAGYNLVITGLVGMLAFILVFEALFAKGSSGDFGRFAGAALVVYGGAWAACGIQFGQLVRDDTTPPPSVPPVIREPSPAPTPTPTPGLPSLGGGSFPPVDRT